MPAHVSVALPVYRGARYLEASLRSVFAQSFRNFDVTVVDDGSTDDSVAIAERVARDYGAGIPFRIIRNTTRLGLVGNWNRCLDFCTGDYSLLLSNNHSTGGTCFGDSGGPNFIGDSNVVGGVTSFGTTDTCKGHNGAYRVDQPDDLEWLATFGLTPG